MPAGITSYEPFDKLNLRIERSTSLLIDPWASKDTAQVNQRVRNLVNKAAAPLLELQPAIDLAVKVLDNKLPGLTDIRPPRFVNLESWTDLVPADRLSP